MTLKTYKNCKDLYQRDTGAEWQNLVYARTGDGRASYVYPKGSGSKTEYKPKDLVYRYSTDFLDPSLWTIDASTFTVVFGKYKIKENAIPKIRVYTGKKGNNTFIREVKTYTKKENVLENDTYTIQYNLGSLTPEQWNKGIMIKLVWEKTKTTKESTISINRARCSVKYHRSNSRIAIYSSVNTEEPDTKNGVIWSITVKNSGDCDATSIGLTIPYGAKLTDLGGDGVWDSEEYPDEIFIPNICNGQSKTHKFKVVFPYEGIFEMVACNQWNMNVVNVCASSVVNVFQYMPDEEVTIIPHESYDNEESYFDVKIRGEANGHKYRCYELSFPSNIQVGSPVRSIFTDSDMGTDSNVEEINRNDTITYEYEGRTISIDVGDNLICVKLDNPNMDFETYFRIPFKAIDEGTGIVTVRSVSNGKVYDGEIVILPKRVVKFIILDEKSQDMQFVQNSINVGSPDIWTIRVKSHRHNFFDMMKSDFTISIEKLIAYIGCVPLSRGHKADVTSDVTNTLIDNRYLNRRYLGKEGDYLEKITMTLRLHWTDIATLKGLLEMDKPIPVDTCPELPDGDPLNHRGWCELSEIKNIKKINDMLYQCEPTVDYITHELLTLFSIQSKSALTDTSIRYFLSNVHDYGDDLLEKFNVSFYQFFTNLEDENGELVGAYEIEPSTYLSFTSKDVLNTNCNYDIKYRNELPVLMSADYDNNWEMAIRINDKETGQTLFEHLYNNFQHYDYDNKRVANKCDVTSKVFDGTNFTILNYDTISLGYGSLAQLVEDRRIHTHFNSLDNTEFDGDNDSYEIFLVNGDNEGIPNQKVEITIENTIDNSVEKIKKMTDIWGRIILPISFNEGNYSFTFTYDGTSEYKSCTYTVEGSISYEYSNIHFEYGDYTGSPYIIQLLDDNDNPIEGLKVEYAIRNIGSEEYFHKAESGLSDNEGKISIIPYGYVGTKYLKVSFNGYTDNNNNIIYNPASFEEIINVLEGDVVDDGIVIEADDFEFMQGDEAIYNVLVKDSNGNFKQNYTINFYLYNETNTFHFTGETNAQGVVQLPLYLNRGIWKIDITHNGTPLITKTITVIAFSKKDTSIEFTGETLVYEDIYMTPFLGNTPIRESYRVTLFDENHIVLKNKPLHLKAYSLDRETKYVDVIMKTNDNGEVVFPFFKNNEECVIEVTYEGSMLYNGSSRADIVECISNDNWNKTEPDVYVEDNKLILNCSKGEIDLTSQGYNPLWWFDYDLIFIINEVGNNYDSYMIVDEMLPPLKDGIYDITIMSFGNRSDIRFSKTVRFEKLSDSRERLNLIPSFTYSRTGSNMNGMVRANINGVVRKYGTQNRTGIPSIMYFCIGASEITAPDPTLEDYLECCESYVEIIPTVNLSYEFENYRFVDSQSFSATFDFEDLCYYEGDIPCRLVAPSTMITTLTVWEGTYNPQYTGRPELIDGYSTLIKGFTTNTYNHIELQATSYEENDIPNNSQCSYRVDLINETTYEMISMNLYHSRNETNSAFLDVLLEKGEWTMQFAVPSNGVCNAKTVHSTKNVDTDSVIEPPVEEEPEYDINSETLTPDAEDYDGSIFGSNVSLALRNNVLNFTDYGFLPQGDIGGAKVLLDNIELPVAQYELELWINYNNSRFERLNLLKGFLQTRIFEDISSTGTILNYSKLMCSPVPCKDSTTRFTRLTDEGLMYFVEPKSEESNPKYLCNPYIQYKGGTELTTETGISIFNLDNAYSPVALSNGLVKAEFHRRSGYIVLSRFDELSEDWYICNTLHLDNLPQLSLKKYDDDKVVLNFGSTVWTMWRGRPFIKVEHSDSDFRILDLANRVYCETTENELGMGFIEEHNSYMSIFSPKQGTQLFKGELHIGENIRLDNFELCNLDGNNNERDLSSNAQLSLKNENGNSAIKVIKNSGGRVGVTFPNANHYVRKPSSTFSLLIEYVKVQNESNAIVIARGYDENGKVNVNGTYQYGVWKNVQTVSLNEEVNEIRVTFNDVPDTVKYIDFTLGFVANNSSEVVFKDIMLYEGDSQLPHDVDYSQVNAINTEISFNETYYACIYDDDSPCGLAIARLDQEPFTLRNLKKGKETILMPYMKNYKEYDSVDHLLLEYLNSNDQKINVDWHH